jgi:hypothetical protein
MNTITSFNKQNLPTIAADINAELAKIATKYGLQSLQIGSVTFDATSCKIQISGMVDPVSSPEAQQKNKSFSEMLGYSDNIVGLKFTSKGRTFEVTSIDLKRPKFPINAKDLADGKPYKFAADRALKFTTEVEYDETKNAFSAVNR